MFLNLERYKNVLSLCIKNECIKYVCTKARVPYTIVIMDLNPDIIPKGPVVFLNS